MPKFKVRFHEEVYVDLCVEAPSREAVTFWADDLDGTFADVTAEHLAEQTVINRYIDVPELWVPELWGEEESDMGIVYEVDAEGKQTGKR